MSPQRVEIAWKRDVQAGLDEARQRQPNALLDFSAAPM